MKKSYRFDSFFGAIRRQVCEKSHIYLSFYKIQFTTANLT